MSHTLVTKMFSKTGAKGWPAAIFA